MPEVEEKLLNPLQGNDELRFVCPPGYYEQHSEVLMSGLLVGLFRQELSSSKASALASEWFELNSRQQLNEQPPTCFLRALHSDREPTNVDQEALPILPRARMRTALPLTFEGDLARSHTRRSVRERRER